MSRLSVNLNNTNVGFVERTESVKQYFKDIRRYKVLTSEEEHQLFEIIKADTNQEAVMEAKHKLITSNQLLVSSVARKLTTNEQFLDCISVGTMALETAIENFDIDKGVKFATYAVPYIYRDISQYLRDVDPTIKKSNISKTYHYVPQVRNKFIQENEREPTDEELMDILNDEYNQNIKDPQDVREMTMYSIDEDFGDEDDDPNPNTYMFNSFSAVGNDYDTDVENDYNKQLMSSVLQVLTPREADIVKMSFGIDYPREYEAQEIATMLKLTPERVRQLKNAALERLKDEVQKRLKTNPLI